MANRGGRTVAIPHKYDDEIMSLVADGKTTDDIVLHLLVKHQLVANKNTLIARINTIKKQNQAVAHAALAQQVVKSTINHTQIFEKNIMRLEEQIEIALDSKKPLVASDLMKTELQIQRQHLSLLGLDKPLNDDDEILKRLAGG